MKSELFVLIGVVVFLILLVVGLSFGPNSFFIASQNPDSIKIGLTLPLTGEAASFGQSGLAGAMLAVDEINSSGGINGKKINLFVEDDKCSSEAGLDAAQKLVNVDNVEFVTGFVCSTAAAPALRVLEEQKIPSVLLMAAAPDLTKVGGLVFRIYPSNTLQGEEAAKFVVQILKKKNMAIVKVNNDWGEGLGKAFANKVLELGGNIVLIEAINPGFSDYKGVFAKVKASGADALYLPLYPADSVLAFKQIKELGLELPVVGADSWSGQEVYGSEYSRGMIFIVPKVNLPKDFSAKLVLLRGFENLKINYNASLAYDAVKIFAESKAKSEKNNSSLIEEFRKDSFEGVSSARIAFNLKGDVTEYSFDVMKITNNSVVNYLDSN
ncbi:MAG: ABC transporter substrate-binding protein [archaeon]|jgi:branched-chain amino acid transport system substrate-binding protein